jgi:hypothetical protein
MMPSQPDETAREALGNVLMLMSANTYQSSRDESLDIIMLSNVDMLAIRARLRSALAKLDREGPPVGWTETKSEDRALSGQEPE